MLTYILEIIFFISAGFVLYLFIKKLPVIEEAGIDEEVRKKKTFMQEKLAQFADEKLVSSSLKVLRRVRLTLLKIDNLIAKNLEKMKIKAEEQKREEKTNILFEATQTEKKEEKNE